MKRTRWIQSDPVFFIRFVGLHHKIRFRSAVLHAVRMFYNVVTIVSLTRIPIRASSCTLVDLLYDRLESRPAICLHPGPTRGRARERDIGYLSIAELHTKQ